MTCRVRDVTRRPGAYTFLEMALAMAIVAIVFIAVAPLVSASLQERRLRHALEDIEQYVRDNRLAAEEHRAVVDLVWQNGGLSASSSSQVRVDERLFIRFPQGKWAAADGQSWRIFSSGIVAPLSVRVEEGKAWLEGDFDPLTGSIAEERYSF